MASSVSAPREPGRNLDTAHGEYVLTKDWAGEHERLQLLEATVDH
jgi:hypothetical protein